MQFDQKGAAILQRKRYRKPETNIGLSRQW